MSSLTIERLSSLYITDSTGANNMAVDASGYLTVNVNGTVTVSATDLDIRDLIYTSDSVTAHQGGTWTIDSITNDVSIDDGGNSITVDAVDLDIRDITHLSDSIKIGDGVEFLAVNADGSINVVCSATDFDIRDLSHTQDSVKIGDGVEFLAINADGSINVNMTDDSVADGDADTGNPIKVGGHAYNQANAWSAVDADDRVNNATDLYRRQIINDAPNISASCAAVSVADTEALLGTAIAGRTRILIQNNSTVPIFVGPTGVSTSSGLEVSKKSTLSLELGESIDLYGIASTAGPHDVRVMQLA